MQPDADDLLRRFADGEALPAEEQRRLAEALRRDSGLRRRLRQDLVGQARLARAVRTARTAPATSRLRLRPAPRRLPPWLAVAATLVLGGGALAWWLLATPAVAPPAEQPAAAAPAPEVVEPHGSFALTDRPGSLVLPDTSRVELEAGSSGTVTGGAMNLASGGALLRMAPDGEGLRVEAGPATITASGDVAVRYLEVPEGREPAIQVEVGAGRARIDCAGARHELGRGEVRVLAPGGEVSATVQGVEPRRFVLQAGGGSNRMRWVIGGDAPPPLLSQGRPVAFGSIQQGWNVRVQLDANRREVIAVEVPEQAMGGTVLSWDPGSRILVIDRDHFGRQPPMQVPPSISEHPVVGRPLRLTLDPATHAVVRCTVVDPAAHHRPLHPVEAAPHPRQP